MLLNTRPVIARAVTAPPMLPSSAAMATMMPACISILPNMQATLDQRRPNRLIIKLPTKLAGSSVNDIKAKLTYWFPAKLPEFSKPAPYISSFTILLIDDNWRSKMFVVFRTLLWCRLFYYQTSAHIRRVKVSRLLLMIDLSFDFLGLDIALEMATSSSCKFSVISSLLNLLIFRIIFSASSTLPSVNNRRGDSGVNLKKYHWS